MREIKATVGFAYTHKEVEAMLGKSIANFLQDIEVRESVYDRMEDLHGLLTEVLYYEDEIKVLID